MKKILLGSLCVLLLTSLLGCETFKGVAKDLENTGKNIHDYLSGETE